MAALSRSHRTKSMARAGRFAALGLALLLSSCDANDPFQVTWTAAPDTALLYSLARPELDLPSAYNFVARTVVRIERAGAATQFDAALDTRGGQLVLLPPGAFGIDSRARLATLPGMTFDEVEEAPADTLLYTATDPVPVGLGNVYIIRTKVSGSFFGTGCSYFAKLEPLSVDVTSGMLSFVYAASPICNDRRLVPPDN